MKKIVLLTTILLHTVLRIGLGDTNSLDAPLSIKPNAVPEEIKDAYLVYRSEGKRNEVLNCMQLGKDAIYIDDYDLAAKAFEIALRDIELIYANNERAARARGMWHEEKEKDFKGEPYERVMAYYYRGITFLRDHDFENARACFKAGILQDAFAEEEQYRCDFAILHFLEGWCSFQLGDFDTDTWKATYPELGNLRPDFQLPISGDNTLILVETGKSPRKLADGVGHAEIVYRRGKKFKDVRVKVTIDGSYIEELYPMEDVYWQASTRGGRPVDRILEGKIVFRESTEGVGTILTGLGEAAAPVWADPSHDSNNLGSALVGAGAVVQLFGSRAKPHADIRYWKNLPDGIHCLSTRLPSGSHHFEFTFFDKNGNELSDLLKSVYVDIDEESGNVVYSWSREQLYSKMLTSNDEPWKMASLERSE